MGSVAKAARLLCSAFCVLGLFYDIAAVKDDDKLKTLEKCTRVAQKADVDAAATNMCDDGSQTYKDFVACAELALKNTCKFGCKDQTYFSVKDAMDRVKNTYCAPFPLLKKYPATFYRTVQASLIIQYENMKRVELFVCPSTMDFLFGEKRADHILWDGAVEDHIHQGLSTEIYSQVVEEGFWKHTYGLSTPTNEQISEIKAAAMDCLEVSAGAEKANRREKWAKLCKKAIDYRTNGITREELHAGRSKLVSFEACVRARYHLRRAPKRELLVMEETWEDPAPAHGMLILQKDDTAATKSQNNPVNGEIVVVESEFDPIPPEGLYEVLSFIIHIACSYNSGRIKATAAKRDMCDEFDDLVSSEDITFSHDDIIKHRIQHCVKLLSLSETVAFEMLEKAPWVAWTGGKELKGLDSESASEEEIVLGKALDIGSCKKCFARFLESTVKKVLCDTVFAIVAVPIATVNILAQINIRLPGTDNFQLLIQRFYRCVVVVAKAKTAAYREQQEALGNKTPMIDKFLEDLKNAGADKLPQDPSDMDDLNSDDKAQSKSEIHLNVLGEEGEALDHFDLNIMEKLALILDENSRLFLGSNKFIRKFRDFAQKHRRWILFIADVSRFIPVVSDIAAPIVAIIQDLLGGYGETAEMDSLRVEKEDSLWKKTLKRVAKIPDWFANMYNKVCDVIWAKVKEILKLGKTTLQDWSAKSLFEEFKKARKDDLEDTMKFLGVLTDAVKEYKEALGDGWQAFADAVTKSNEKFKARLKKAKPGAKKAKTV